MQGGIGIRPADRLDERANDVVVLVTLPVIPEQCPIDRASNDFVGDDGLALARERVRRRACRSFEGRQRPAGIPRRQADDRGPGLGGEFDGIREAPRIGDGAINHNAKVFVAQLLESQQQRP